MDILDLDNSLKLTQLNGVAFNTEQR